MRNKHERSSSGAQYDSQGNDRERPMSWEGELSDSEMVIDTSVNNGEGSYHAKNRQVNICDPKGTLRYSYFKMNFD